MLVEGKDYYLTVDPKSSNPDDWSVILTGSWDRVVGRYKDITIKGEALSFSFEAQYVPEGVDLETKEFETYLGFVLNSILETHHEKKAMVYVSKETGETVPYE